jgi:hypothetical protein
MMPPSSGTRTEFQVLWEMLVRTTLTLPSIMAALMMPGWTLEKVVVLIELGLPDCGNGKFDP